MPGHFEWEAFKHPEMRCWGFHDEIGFTYVSNDRDGWATKRVVRLLNEAETLEQKRLNPSSPNRESESDAPALE